MTHEHEVDAVAEIRRLSSDGAATMDKGSTGLKPATKGFLVLCGCLMLAAVVGFGFKKYAANNSGTGDGAAEAAREPETKIGGASGFRPAPAAAESAPAPEKTTAQVETQSSKGNPGDYRPSPNNYGQPGRGGSQKPEKSPEQVLFERRLSSELGAQTRGTSGGSGAPATPAPANGGSSGSGELADRMQPVRLNASSASVLPNRDLMLTQGAMLDCQLETRLVTTQAGQVVCFLTRNVYSASGRVVLMDQGSKIVGQYQGGLTQGQARIFVLWTRVETPRGVIINIDSSGAGPLGEAGLGGWVDTHFLERFGAAIMISTIDDFGNWVSNQASRGSDNNQITFDSTSDATQDMASTALENTINIPPTLYKNHGERVQILIARDLDFSGVYSLEPK